jgi:hypothetical protein
MRYHLNLRDDAQVIADGEGEEFTTLDAARAGARASVRELVIEDLRNGKPPHGWRVEISNDRGAVLDSIGLQILEN